MARVTGEQMLHVRSMVGLGAAAAVVLALAGCSGGGASTAESTPKQTKTAVAGQATCTLHSGTGKIRLHETADAYEVEWTGLPLDASDSHYYSVQLGNADQSEHTDLVMEWTGTTVRNYGVANDSSGEVTQVEGDPTVSGDTISGTFPKRDGLDASWWAPHYTVIDGSDATSEYCSSDGQVLDYTPLD